MAHVYKIGDKVRRTGVNLSDAVQAGTVGTVCDIVIESSKILAVLVVWSVIDDVFSYWINGRGPDSLDCIEPAEPSSSSMTARQRELAEAMRPLVEWMDNNPHAKHFCIYKPGFKAHDGTNDPQHQIEAAPPSHGLDKQQRFEAAVRPLIQWMNDNPDICDPHTKIMVTLDSAEFLGGGMFHGTKDFLKG